MPHEHRSDQEQDWKHGGSLALAGRSVGSGSDSDAPESLDAASIYSPSRQVEVGAQAQDGMDLEDEESFSDQASVKLPAFFQSVDADAEPVSDSEIFREEGLFSQLVLFI